MSSIDRIREAPDRIDELEKRVKNLEWLAHGDGYEFPHGVVVWVSIEQPDGHGQREKRFMRFGESFGFDLAGAHVILELGEP